MQVAAQNRLAFDELYDRQFKFVFNAAYKRLNADQSADIAKEVFVRLWTRKSDRGRFYCCSDLAYGLDNAELAIAWKNGVFSLDDETRETLLPGAVGTTLN